MKIFKNGRGKYAVLFLSLLPEILLCGFTSPPSETPHMVTDSTPFYQYYDEQGNLQMELYWKEESGTGCGIRYYPEKEPEVFLFEGSDMAEEFQAEDKESVLSVNGNDGKEVVSDYEESITYTEDGRIAAYHSKGVISSLKENTEPQTLLNIKFSYREDGTLQKKEYQHNSFVFGTTFLYKNSYYDSRERIVYEDGYITHGNLEYYYLYEGEGDTPAYILMLDHNLDRLYAEFSVFRDKDLNTKTADAVTMITDRCRETGLKLLIRIF